MAVTIMHRRRCSCSMCQRLAGEELGRQWAEETIAAIRKALDKLPPIKPHKGKKPRKRCKESR